MQVKRSGLVASSFAIVLVLAACGGGGSSTKATAAASTTTTTTRPGVASALTAYRACLVDHGVVLPAGGGARRAGGPSGPSGLSGPSGASGRRGFGPSGPSGPSGASGFRGGAQNRTPAQQKAFQACASLLPAGGFGGNGGAGAGAFAAYRSCLRDHGVTAAAGAGAGAGGNQALRNDPKFAEANKVCGALLPAAGGSSTTSTTQGG